MSAESCAALELKATTLVLKLDDKRNQRGGGYESAAASLLAANALEDFALSDIKVAASGYLLVGLHPDLLALGLSVDQLRKVALLLHRNLHLAKRFN
jgi:hypothetical protein